MRLFPARLVTSLILIVVVPADAGEIACNDLEKCVRSYIEAGDGKPGIGKLEQAYAEKLEDHGAQALTYALEALDSSSDYYAASYLVRQLREHLQPEHLPVLKQTFQGDGDWIPLAIAVIDTPDAYRFLAEKASEHANNSGGDQYSFAFAAAGEKAIPFLLDEISCDEPVEESRIYWIPSIIEEMGPTAASGVPRLEDIALNPSCHESVRHVTLASLSQLSHDGVPLATAKYAPLTNDENDWIRRHAETIITQSGGDAAEEIYRRKILTLPAGGHHYLAEVGRIGPAAISAGPYILERLPDFDFAAKPEAARTLGKIGYKPAIPALIRSLHDPADWEFAQAAAEALGRLRAQEAIPALSRIASEHWFPLTQEAARIAISAIEEDPEGRREIYEPREATGFSNFLSRDRGPKPCATTSEYPGQTPQHNRFYKDENPERAKKLRIPISVPDELRHEDPNLPRTWHEEPNVGVKYGDNWFLGSNRGEWGGHIAVQSGSKDIEVIGQANVEDIYRFSNGRLVAVTGLAHLGFDYGKLQTINETQPGSWQTSDWRKLPGAPHSSWLLGPGTLLVNTSNGSVIITEDGDMRLADCHQH